MESQTDPCLLTLYHIFSLRPTAVKQPTSPLFLLLFAVVLVMNLSKEKKNEVPKM